MAKEKPTGIVLEQFRKSLEKAPPPPVIQMYGPEEFLLDDCLAALTKAATARFGSFTRTSHNGDEVDLATVLDDARALDLFCPFRLIIVRPAGQFIEEHTKQLAAYAEAPAGKSCLVFVTEKLDARYKFTKILDESNAIVSAGRIYEDKLVPWLVTRAKNAGLQLDPEAADTLVGFIGLDLATLAMEIEKLAVYIGNRKHITAEDVEAVSLRHHVQDVFKLTDAICQRNPAQIFNVLNTLVENGEKMPMIVYMVGRHVKRLWSAKELLEKKIPQPQVAGMVGQRFYIDNFFRQVHDFSLNDLRRSCSSLVRCEGLMKSSSGDDRAILETTLIKLADRPPARKAVRLEA